MALGLSVIWLLGSLANTPARAGSPSSSERSLSTPTSTPPIYEFPLDGSSFPNGITTGPDGNLWFTEGDAIGRISPSGVLTEFPVPTFNPLADEIASGPDGNLWFTENQVSKIGQITPSGTITEFPTPTAASSPTGIVGGPDGNIWFTEYQAGQIGRITPTGTITEFPLPNLTSNPKDITVGPDGSLWFTEFGSNQIGSITTDGTITEFGGLTLTNPLGIALGPDGNLWFTGWGNSMIGKMTTDGVVTEYTIPTANSSPMGIAPGPDGNLWFAEFSGNKVGVVTTSGSFVEYAIPTSNGMPAYVTTGPDGNVWLTENNGHKIARVQLVPLPRAHPADFNGDGFAELVVGVPWEDIGSVTDTGAGDILYATANGLASAGNQFWDQSSTGSASNGPFDGFGYSSATGDFNADGYADLVLSAPGKKVGTATYGGAVSVLYGTSAGLSAVRSQQWTQDSTDVEESAETNDFFGWSVAAGDLNGDGFADLAVGVPGETVGTHGFAGGVNVLYGSVTGLTATGDQFWSQDSPNINNKGENDDQFGLSVAIGDFDGNGFEDLAVGVALENLTNGVDAGAVNVIYGSAIGLTSAADDFWNQDADGINNKVEDGDLFGYRVTSGDFNGNGFDDLLIGVPAEDLTGGSDAGAVNVIYGTASGLDDPGDDFWNQDSTGITNEAEKLDQFGLAVTAGDFDGNGFDDAAIGVVGEDVSGKTDSGGVAVIYGASGGLDDPGNDFWHQNSSGIEDSAETNDFFGYAIVAANFGNGPEEDLAIGVPLENVTVTDQGAVNVIYGSPSDLTSTADQFWNQDSTDILDQGEVDDEFGFGLADPGTGGLAPTNGLFVRFAQPR